MVHLRTRASCSSQVGQFPWLPRDRQSSCGISPVLLDSWNPFPFLASPALGKMAPLAFFSWDLLCFHFKSALLGSIYYKMHLAVSGMWLRSDPCKYFCIHFTPNSFLGWRLLHKATCSRSFCQHSLSTGFSPFRFCKQEWDMCPNTGSSQLKGAHTSLSEGVFQNLLSLASGEGLVPPQPQSYGIHIYFLFSVLLFLWR